MLRHVAYRLLRAFATLDEPLEHRQIVRLKERIEALEMRQAGVRLERDPAIEPGQPLMQRRVELDFTGEANHALR